jgi:hypothetical protein
MDTRRRCDDHWPVADCSSNYKLVRDARKPACQSAKYWGYAISENAARILMLPTLRSLLRRPETPKNAMAPCNIDEFAELLARSGIATSQQANEWLALFRAEHFASDSPKAIADFCNFLNSMGSVTEWQCEKLKLGRWKGFYFEEHYLLLEQVGKGGSDASSYYSSYKACDIRTKSLVCLFIVPWAYSGGYFKYRVYPYM